MRPHVAWAIVSVFVFCVMFAGGYFIHSRVTAAHGGRVDVGRSVMVGGVVAGLVTSFIAGFGYMVIYGAIYPAERAKRAACPGCGADLQGRPADVTECPFCGERLEAG